MQKVTALIATFVILSANEKTSYANVGGLITRIGLNSLTKERNIEYFNSEDCTNSYEGALKLLSVTEVEIEVEIPSEDEILQHQVAFLEAKKDALTQKYRAEFHVIESQLQSLLAIESKAE